MMTRSQLATTLALIRNRPAQTGSIAYHYGLPVLRQGALMTFNQLQKTIALMRGKPAQEGTNWNRAGGAPTAKEIGRSSSVSWQLDGGSDLAMMGPLIFRNTPLGWVTITPITRAQWREYEPTPVEWQKTWVNAAWEHNLPATDITLKQIDDFISNINLGLMGSDALPDSVGVARLPRFDEAVTMAVAQNFSNLNDYGTFAWQPWMQPVGFSAPNAWGLWDTVGCVWQWCADGPEEQEVVQPFGTIYTYRRRYASGASWKYKAKDSLPEVLGGQGYFGYAAHEEVRGRDIGFRLIVPKAADTEPLDETQSTV